MLLLALVHLCHAQAYKNEKLIYLDSYGEKTKEKNADVLEQLIKFDDTLYQINLYHIDRPMFRSFYSNDPNGNVLVGAYRAYDAMGRTDSLGGYQAGKRQGDWAVYSNGRYTKELMYDQGKLVWVKDTLQLKKEDDSIAAGKKEDSAGDGEDRIFTKVEIESAYPGGVQAWINYLQKNMHYPDRAVMKHIEGKVIVAFVVDKQGRVPPEWVFVDHSVEYALDQEALRIIFASSNWTPAIRNGKAVSSYKKQPIIFRF